MTIIRWRDAENAFHVRVLQPQMVAGVELSRGSRLKGHELRLRSEDRLRDAQEDVFGHRFVQARLGCCNFVIRYHGVLLWRTRFNVRFRYEFNGAEKRGIHPRHIALREPGAFPLECAFVAIVEMHVEAEQ